MQVPSGSERFTFPDPQAANSPPSTPESASSFQASPPRYTRAGLEKRYGFIGPILSPPENIAPIAGNKFSYTPPQRQSSSDSGSEESDDSEAVESSSDEEESDIELDSPQVPKAPRAPYSTNIPPPQLRRSSINAWSFESSSIDFTIEEITEDDIDYDSEAEVLLPSHCEEVNSDHGEDTKPNTVSDSSELEEESDADDSLLKGLDNLHCDAREEIRKKEQEFEEKRQEKYLRRKKRWSKGGNHKRSITESIGSASDNEDITPLDDADVVGSSARRLRRRTEGPEARPRKSLLFDDPPNEIEELKYLDGDGEVIDTDDELMLPDWMYPTIPAMEVDVDGDND